MALDPFSLITSAITGAAGGVAHEIEPELQKAQQIAQQAGAAAPHPNDWASYGGAAAPAQPAAAAPRFVGQVRPVSFGAPKKEHWSARTIAIVAVGGTIAVGGALLVGRFIFGRS